MKTGILLPFTLEYKINGVWHEYGRYRKLDEAKHDRSEATVLDLSNDMRYDYRILETKIVED